MLSVHIIKVQIYEINPFYTLLYRFYNISEACLIPKNDFHQTFRRLEANA